MRPARGGGEGGSVGEAESPAEEGIVTGAMYDLALSGDVSGVARVSRDSAGRSLRGHDSGAGRSYESYRRAPADGLGAGMRPGCGITRTGARGDGRSSRQDTVFSRSFFEAA